MLIYKVGSIRPEALKVSSRRDADVPPAAGVSSLAHDPAACAPPAVCRSLLPFSHIHLAPIIRGTRITPCLYAMFKAGQANPYDEIVGGYPFPRHIGVAPSSNSYLAKTTDENLTGENWELILNLCDKVQEEGEQG